MNQTTDPTLPQFPAIHQVFKGTGVENKAAIKFPDAPPWRDFEVKAALKEKKEEAPEERGKGYVARPEEIQAVNLALYLRRPLLVTGDPGTGKSTLAHAIAYELKLGRTLVWPVTSRSNLQQALYQYDAIGRMQEAAWEKANVATSLLGREAAKAVKASGKKEAKKASNTEDIGRFIRLGPLGTALYASTQKNPRVLLIDEIDKSDIDLPNDLLHIFEEGEFEIPELSRIAKKSPSVDVSQHRGTKPAKIIEGHVQCNAFPIVVLTSNGERDFPPAFLRRCIRLDIKPPTGDELVKIVANRIAVPTRKKDDLGKLLKLFEDDRDKPDRELSTDQLLNAVYLLTRDVGTINLEELRKYILRPLSNLRMDADNQTAGATEPEKATK